jgi:hypothetical protein
MIKDIEGLAPCVSVSLVRNEVLLRDQFNAGQMRWQTLAEYGIADGTTLGFVKSELHRSRSIHIVLRLLDGDREVLPINIDAEAKRTDLERCICEKEGLDSAEHAVSITLPSGELLRHGTTLAESGIDDGSTLGVRIEIVPRLVNREKLRDITNLMHMSPRRRSAVTHFRSANSPPLKGALPEFRASSPERPNYLSASYSQQFSGSPSSTLERIADMSEKTPTRKMRSTIDQTPAACQQKKYQQVKAAKALKRL